MSFVEHLAVNMTKSFSLITKSENSVVVALVSLGLFACSQWAQLCDVIILKSAAIEMSRKQIRIKVICMYVCKPVCGTRIANKIIQIRIFKHNLIDILVS